MSNQEADVLRCWRCRKYIANSVCLAKCHGKGLSEQTSQPSAATQESCNMWHGNLESIPAWVNCDIEKAQWTIGKLHCPFCEACLGGFVCNTKCSCGQLVNIHFCKSRTDCQPAFSIKLAKSPGKHLPCLKIQSGFSKDTFREAGTATLEIKNQGLSYMTRNNNGTERLTEALSLEVRAPGFEVESEKLPLKALNKKRNLSASCPVNDACTVKHFHRRSRSLDLNIRETLVLSPALYEACSMETIYRSRNENPPIDTSSDLQLESGRKDGSSFQDLCGFSADKLLKRFRVASFSTLVHREAESECDFEATGQSSGSNVADGSPFVMNLSSPTSAVEEEQYITAVGLVQPISISFHQKLSKRERNKLKSLRRKQRRGEWWLQKQTANDNLHTDDEHELRGDKESYLCAVCLDVYFNPYMCYPCHHIFCEPCLRMLAKDNPAHTPCPLCRTTIARVFFQTELNNSTKSFFPMEYLKLKENFQKSNSAKWPLPSCKKAFRVFEGFQRRSDTVTRRHFPHAAHRMDYVDFEDDSHGWWFDMDMVIIYIYSVNWVIGFIVFCFLCYFFFPF
ncbi:E3 ubiquitin-protein ligase RNF180 isoform X2 [Opisthocomus hoazin]|uniref:E3 ubiquitin-protein ligase RNF180 isoform X2 n=1 Tax=Opisthocomus hoazin TaxID=30419 RepID=UPI003F53248D